jgi:DNA mismatch endonuclease, patch repair protein
MRRPIVKRLATQADRLTAAERSAHMSKVKSTGNRSTEMHVAAHLVRNGIRGWRRHPRDIPGQPDFVFAVHLVVVFVDGCFWHGCPRCSRNLPRTRREFWQSKIAANRKRDRTVDRLLRSQDYRVIRIWEHALRDGRWLISLRAALGG